jgi:hypothetical protein
MTKTEDLTPHHLRCGFGSCPSVHRLEDGRLMIVGQEAETRAVELPSGHFQDQAVIGDVSISDAEEAVIIDAMSDAEFDRHLVDMMRCPKCHDGGWVDRARYPAIAHDPQRCCEAAELPEVKINRVPCDCEPGRRASRDQQRADLT